MYYNIYNNNKTTIKNLYSTRQKTVSNFVSQNSRRTIKKWGNGNVHLSFPQACKPSSTGCHLSLHYHMHYKDHTHIMSI